MWSGKTVYIAGWRCRDVIVDDCWHRDSHLSDMISLCLAGNNNRIKEILWVWSGLACHAFSIWNNFVGIFMFPYSREGCPVGNRLGRHSRGFQILDLEMSFLGLWASCLGIWKQACCTGCRRRPSPAEAPPIGKIRLFSKMAVTFEPLMGFWCPSGFRKFWITTT